MAVIVRHSCKYLIVQLLFRQIHGDIAVLRQRIRFGIDLLQLAEHRAGKHLVSVKHRRGVVHFSVVIRAFGKDCTHGVIVSVVVVRQVVIIIPRALQDRKIKLRTRNAQPSVNIRIFFLK